MTEELPKGWAKATVGDVVAPKITQKTPLAGEQISYIDISSIDNTSKMITEAKSLPGENAPSRARQVTELGDVLVSMTRPNLNAVALVDSADANTIASTGFAVLRPIAVESKFLFAIVRSNSFVKEMSALVQGALYPAVRPSDIRDFLFALPPLNEQKRIVKKIEAIQSRSKRAREALETIPPLIEKFRQSVLASAFRGDLTKEWREKNKDKIEPSSILLKRIRIERRKKWEEEQLKKFQTTGKMPKDDKWKEKYKEPEAVDTEGLPELPEGWEWCRVADVSSVSLGRQRSPQNHIGPHMRKYVRAANITWNGWQLDDINEMNFDQRDFARFALQAGDVLINEGSGSPKEIGKPAIWNNDIPECCFQNTLILSRPDLPISQFLYFCFLHAALRGLFISNTQGINIAHIGQEGLANFRIPFPPLVEQQVLIEKLMEAERIRTLVVKYVKNCLSSCSTLDQSILAKAFRGELVPQDPNDEPADILLERIKKDREQQPLKTKPSKPNKAKSKKEKSPSPNSKKSKEMELGL